MSAKQIKRVARREAAKIVSKKNNKEEIRQNVTDQSFNQEVDFSNTNVGTIESESESSYSSCENDAEFDLCRELSNWAVEFAISFVALNALLRLLLKCKIKVPKDARTLLKTPTEVVKKKK